MKCTCSCVHRIQLSNISVFLFVVQCDLYFKSLKYSIYAKKNISVIQAHHANVAFYVQFYVNVLKYDYLIFMPSIIFYFKIKVLASTVYIYLLTVSNNNTCRPLFNKCFWIYNVHILLESYVFKYLTDILMFYLSLSSVQNNVLIRYINE